MFVAELCEGTIETPDLLQALVIVNRVRVACDALKAITGELSFLDGVHATAREAAPLVNEKVVHNASQPGPWLVDVDEVVDLGEGFYQQLLKKVLGFGFRAGQAPRQPVQAIEVRSHESFEYQVLLSAAHCA